MKLSMVVSSHVSRFKAATFQGDFEENVAYIASCGYDGVEVAVRDPELLDYDRAMGALKKHDLAFPAIGTGQAWNEEGLSFTDKDPAVRERAIERIKSHIELAGKTDAVLIIGLLRGVIREGVSEKQANDWLVDALKMCTRAAEKAAARIALEPINRYETSLINTVDQGLELIDKIGSANLGLLLDTFHMNIEEASIEDSIKRCGPGIFHFHVADSNRRYPGAGHLDFASILDALCSTGYQGFISGEFLPDPDARVAAKKSIQYLKSLNVERG